MPESTNATPAIQAVWVVGRYKGEQAKKVLANAGEGVGYIILENPGNKLNPDVVAAFRMIKDPRDGIPEHLVEVVDPIKIAEYERKRLGRSGHRPPEQSKPASDKGIQAARDIFEKRQQKLEA